MRIIRLVVGCQYCGLQATYKGLRYGRLIELATKSMNTHIDSAHPDKPLVTIEEPIPTTTK